MTRMILSAVAALLLLTAGSAFADLTPTGDPVEGGSWAQSFQEYGVGNFDLVAVRMTSSGDTFESPVHSNFTDGSWAMLSHDDGTTPTIASASGNALNWMQWDIKFAGPNYSNPLEFDFVAFNGNTLLESAHALWDGAGLPGNQPVPGWTITAGTWTPSRAEITPIPAPAALLLGAIGLGLAGWLKRRVG